MNAQPIPFKDFKPTPKRIASTQGKPARLPRGQSKLARRKQRIALGSALSIGAVGATLTGLSLSHLAEGIALVTHSAAWQSWSMAIGVDVGFVALEVAQVLVTAPHAAVRKAFHRYGLPTTIGSLAVSAAMNAAAFCKDADTAVQVSASVALGMAIPAMIYALTRISTTLAQSALKGE